jgi:hypothetical protein
MEYGIESLVNFGINVWLLPQSIHRPLVHLVLWSTVPLFCSFDVISAPRRVSMSGQVRTVPSVGVQAEHAVHTRRLLLGSLIGQRQKYNSEHNLFCFTGR